MTNKFQYAIAIKPLGLLYGSAGGFLSPENLVGRSSTKFPPDATTLSGVYAAHYGEQSNELKTLQLAGSFWSYEGDELNFYVPTPFNCLVKEGKIHSILVLNEDKWRLPQNNLPEDTKFTKHSWIALSDWQYLSNLKDNSPVAPQGNQLRVKVNPWESLPHLHPRLKKEQRIVHQNAETNQGSLFLENAIQLESNVCLIYLANFLLPHGWYRFGGEGHMVEIESHPLNTEILNLLDKPVGDSFALISPGVWGTNRLSYRVPVTHQKQNDNSYKADPVWKVKDSISSRPRPFRYRLGKKKKTDKPESENPSVKDHLPKLLSRGRYAVPPGSVYVLEEELPSWYEWEQSWFPKEGYSLKRWGCSLALPLPVANYGSHNLNV